MTENDSHLLMSVLNELYRRSDIVYRVERITNDGEYLVMTSWDTVPYVVRKVATIDGQEPSSNMTVHLYSGSYALTWEQAVKTWNYMHDRYMPALVWDKEEATYKEVTNE